MARRGPKVTPNLDDYLEHGLAAMTPYGELVDAACAEFGLSERGITKAIARVRERWMRTEQTTVEERRAKFRAELEHAWREALLAGDFRAIAQMAKVRADVDGIRAPRKVEVGGTLGLRPVAAMNPREREVEIATLLAKRAAARGESPPALPPPSLDDIEVPGEDVPPSIFDLEAEAGDDDAPPGDLKPVAKRPRGRKQKPSAKRRASPTKH